jgi:uncharacterized protein involved in outer membrane biogenesis
VTPGLRRLLVAASTLVLVALLAMAISVYLLLQPDRFTAMLQDQAHQAGLVLNLGSPASPTVFPRPALDLRGITLIAEGADDPILVASSGRLVLPWSTLLGGPVAITQMEVDEPRVDLGALQSWLAAQPSPPTDAAPVIPRIDAGISIEHGSLVHGDQLLLNNVALTVGTLIPDHPFSLDMSANAAAGAPLRLRLTATPHMQGNALQLNDIQLHLAQGGSTTLVLHGHADWHGAANANAQLDGKLEQADAGSHDVALTLTPADQNNPLLLHLKLDGTDNHADLSLPPLALTRWWGALSAPTDPQAASQPELPPGNGTLHVAKLQIGNLDISDLNVQVGASTPAAASSAAGKPNTGGPSR